METLLTLKRSFVMTYVNDKMSKNSYEKRRGKSCITLCRKDLMSEAWAKSGSVLQNIKFQEAMAQNRIAKIKFVMADGSETERFATKLRHGQNVIVKGNGLSPKNVTRYVELYYENGSWQEKGIRSFITANLISVEVL